MWNQALLKDEVEDFLRKNLQKDLPSLLLKGSPFPEISIQELGTQLNGLQIARKISGIISNQRNPVSSKIEPGTNFFRSHGEVQSRTGFGSKCN